MKRLLVTLATFALLIFLASTALAASGGDNACNPNKVAGAYVRNRPNTFSGSGPGLIDQLVLNNDGTAYWYQSTAFDLMVTTASFIPQIGSWKCIDNSTLVVTTVGTTYHSTATASGPDLVKDGNQRLTQKLSIVDDDTLQTLVRVFSDLPLTEDPLGSNVTNTSVSTVQVPYKRIKPILSDLP